MKKALVTGASSGLGREFARLLAPHCKEIVIVGRNEERLSALREELSAVSEVKAVRADLSDPAECRRVHAENPGVDLLINDAGFGDYGEFFATSLEKDLSMIDTNAKALHILTKLYLKDMVERDSGRIINVASIAGFMPGPLMATYYATKAYVVSLTESIRTELKKRGSNVKINLLCPGPVKTGFEEAANLGFFFVGTDANKVAEYTLTHLDRFRIVPGAAVKAAMPLMKLLPAVTLASVIYVLQTTKKKKKKSDD